METRKLGSTDLVVSRLGLGLSEIGSLRSAEGRASASRLLNMALDAGITFFDTAACYGVSEELIGESIATRRDEFVLSTKAGHVAGDYSGRPWTAETVRDSIERSLSRIRTDYLDLVHLHSCGINVLERGDVIQVLQDARQAGKTRYIGYSGDNEAATWAIDSGLFDTLQTSYNPVDQKARLRLFAPAEEKGMGIIESSRIPRPVVEQAVGVAGEAAVPIQPGTQSIEVDIQVTWLLR
jgi:aryl-alcohol dehydrogenase-like predicted oxidoreductase